MSEVLEKFFDIPEEKEEFVIDDDQKAEWALLKLKEEKAEMERFVDICEKQVEFYEKKIKTAKERYQSNGLISLLFNYFQTVPKEKTKTQATYSLPSGRLKLKYPTPRYVQDDEKLVKWLENAGLKELINTKKTGKWGELKKLTETIGDKVLVDGEVVEGVTVVERPPVFDVEI